LEPISETISNPNAYGFRPKRSAADAIKRCFIALGKKGSAQYILEADIKGCFDNISHQWVLKHVPMDKVILKQWLKAGYIYQGEAFPTIAGTPQGGIISPCILNIVLSGLEKAVLTTLPAIFRNRKNKIYFSIYADDFIITGATREILEKQVKPAVESFLGERGLTLSEEKTNITHINDGFNFLGVNIRKYNGKLIIKPSKESVKSFLNGIRETIKANKTVATENLIRLLNPKISGWANYHKHNCAKKTFGYIDSKIFEAIWQWARRRHTRKSHVWVRKKYFRSKGFKNWIFSQRVWHEKSEEHHYVTNHY
jgi:RNA-directed DNA polymerase